MSDPIRDERDAAIARADALAHEVAALKRERDVLAAALATKAAKRSQVIGMVIGVLLAGGIVLLVAVPMCRSPRDSDRRAIDNWSR